MIKAILFDWNGVVIDDEQIQCDAYREIFKTHDVELTNDGYYARMGMNDRVFVASVFEESGKAPTDDEITAVVTEKTAKWRDVVTTNVPLFDGVDNFIRKCSREFDLGIVSMAKREEIEHVLELTGLGKHFSVILSSEDIATYKPDPACYREGFRQIDASRTSRGDHALVHSECLVIEDSVAGVQAGRAADLPVLGVTGHVSAVDLRAAGAGAIATRLDDWMPESLRRTFE